MQFGILTSLCAVAASAAAQTVLPPKTAPAAPGAVWLYTAFVDCENSLFEMQTPRGIRTAIPIVGGNFTGPHLSGKILDLGADWGLTDPQTGLFSADTRYNLQTHDGANLFLQTSGNTNPDGTSHLRVIIETGDDRYYWLNNLVAFGLLQLVATFETYVTLRIDVWHLEGPKYSGTFVNGTKYGL
ncbi:hypothetical protein CERZMDRAFT_93701 [Cercospora zeae-maydis SCOH1-5]|uniref:Uncharacterized protein n=1 Tax=Cercospora zeae-maydis SCOH1-5 TaxID=717836 RepID=A0A6A6FSF0_9PEZI|nr:hypothetical protein CERZMDRAFT_93701 [Cercospora zeae-maydis SCOH1-5]